MKCTVCGSSIALFSRTMDGREVAWCGAHAPEDMVKALEDMVRRDSGQETLDRIKRDAHEEVERILASKNPGDIATYSEDAPAELPRFVAIDADDFES